MTPSEYERNAARTRCPQNNALSRMGTASFYAAQRAKFPDTSGVHPPVHSGAQLLHAVLGMTGEVGELAGAIERYAYYEQDFDRRNVIEELGDLLWYVAEACDALDIGMEQVMELNIAKLRKRFPAKFDHDRAKEENRDRHNEVSHIGIDPAKPGTDKTITVQGYQGPASNGVFIPIGEGYEAVDRWGEAQEWYDFKANRWKRMSMAGYHHPEVKLLRRKIKTRPIDPKPVEPTELPKEYTIEGGHRVEEVVEHPAMDDGPAYDNPDNYED